MPKESVKNVPRERLHYDVLRAFQKRRFNALYKVYYYNVFKV